MPDIRHFSLDTDAQTVADAVKEDGAIIIDEVLSPEFIAQLRTETNPYMEGSNLGFDDFAGFKTTRTGGLMVRSQKCRELIAHPDILAPCKLFLEPYCQTVQLHLTQISRIGPGETAQLIHRDRWAWGSHLAHVEPQFNTIWAITDFTSENGATQVVPGSTQWPDDVQIEPEQVTQAEMRAGSVLVYSGSVFHGGGENRTTALSSPIVSTSGAQGTIGTWSARFIVDAGPNSDHATPLNAARLIAYSTLCARNIMCAIFWRVWSSTSMVRIGTLEVPGPVSPRTQSYTSLPIFSSTR